MNDGGPAFPFPRTELGYDISSKGMSLRDWFAGMALSEMDLLVPHEACEILARNAYELADAMIAQREKTP